MENRLWVTPKNDLEAKTIVEMLQREGEDVLITGQAWGILGKIRRGIKNKN